MLANPACSWGSPIEADAACCWIATELSRSIAEVRSIIDDVVVFRAVIWSSTSFWLPSAWATMTAVRRAEMVVVDARSTPLMSSMLFLMTMSIAR
jgi:hypothetical protein